MSDEQAKCTCFSTSHVGAVAAARDGNCHVAALIAEARRRN
jgi:hypothetical protein